MTTMVFSDDLTLYRPSCGLSNTLIKINVEKDELVYDKCVSKNSRSSLSEEAKVLMTLSGHRQFLEYVDYYKCRNYDKEVEYHLEMKYFEGMSLVDFAHRYEMTKELVQSIFFQLGKGLDYMHGKGIIHRNLNMDNVLINSNAEIKIVGLDKAVFGPKASGYVSSNEEFTAPEVRAHKKRRIFKRAPKYDSSCDFYSLGVIGKYLKAVSGPKKFVDEDVDAEHILDHKRDNIACRCGLDMDECFTDFVDCLMKDDPSERLSWTAFDKHSFLEDFDEGEWQTKLEAQLLAESELVLPHSRLRFLYLRKVDDHRTDKRNPEMLWEFFQEHGANNRYEGRILTEKRLKEQYVRNIPTIYEEE